MIRDYIVFICLTVIFIFCSLIVSFVYKYIVEKTVEEFSNVYDLSGIQDKINVFLNFGNIIEIVGIIGVFGVIVSSALIVSKVNFSVLALPFGIIIYFIGIYISFIFANTFVYLYSSLLQTYPNYQINPYLYFIGSNLPYIVAFVGFVLMILAYSKASKPQYQGLSVV